MRFITLYLQSEWNTKFTLNLTHSWGEADICFSQLFSILPEKIVTAVTFTLEMEDVRNLSADVGHNSVKKNQLLKHTCAHVQTHTHTHT